MLQSTQNVGGIISGNYNNASIPLAAVAGDLDTSLNANYYTHSYIDDSLNTIHGLVNTNTNSITTNKSIMDTSFTAIRTYVDSSLNANYHIKTYIDDSMNTISSNVTVNRTYIDTSLNANYYTKTYIDDSLNIVNGLVDANRTYIDASLNANYHTKTYIDTSLNAIRSDITDNYHTKTYIDSSLNSIRGDVTNNASTITTNKTIMDTSFTAIRTYVYSSLNDNYHTKSYIDSSLNNHYVTHNAQGDVVISGKLNVDGSINFTGDFIKTDTVVRITEQIDVSNDGTGPALKITKHGEQPVAEFYDDADLVMVIKNG